MAGQRITMMELNTLIRLKRDGWSNRKIASSLHLDRKTVDSYVRRFKEHDLDYEHLSKLGEAELQDLFTQESQVEKERYEILSGYFEYLGKELKKPGSTLQYLHAEYILKHPDGYKLTQFMFHFRKWRSRTDTSGKLIHKAAEKLFIDFCGKKMGYVDRNSGEVVPVEVFVGILPCSQYTFVKAVPSQNRENTVSCMRDCLAYFDGVPLAIVSDNLRAVVTKAHKYAPVINKTFQDFARHYDCVIDPARPYHPQDKALVERSVTLVYQRIYYPLSKHTFFSLEDLNNAIREKLELYNDVLFSHGSFSRRQQYLEIENSHLKPLPRYPFYMREYCRGKVQRTSHVYLSIDKNYYSVPHRYQGLYVEVQYNQNVVEIFYNHERIASHKRCLKPGKYTTTDGHMPSGHRFFTEWNPTYFEERAGLVGPNTVAYITRLLGQYDYPEHGYKQCQGILALERQYSKDRLEVACEKALDYHRSHYRTIERILSKGLDLWEDTLHEVLFSDHGNIRGKENYK